MPSSGRPCLIYWPSTWHMMRDQFGCGPPFYQWVTKRRTTVMLGRVLLNVKALELDKLLKPEFAQRDSFAGVLPTCPREVLAFVSEPDPLSRPKSTYRAGKIASVDKYCSCFHKLREFFAFRGVLRPDTGRESEFAVVDCLDCFLIITDSHDRYYWPKCFLPHYVLQGLESACHTFPVKNPTYETR